MQKRKHPYFLEVSLKVGIFKLVKVKAYKRTRFGKIEKVRGYWRKCQVPDRA